MNVVPYNSRIWPENLQNYFWNLQVGKTWRSSFHPCVDRWWEAGRRQLSKSSARSHLTADPSHPCDYFGQSASNLLANWRCSYSEPAKINGTPDDVRCHHDFKFKGRRRSPSQVEAKPCLATLRVFSRCDAISLGKVASPWWSQIHRLSRSLCGRT